MITIEIPGYPVAKGRPKFTRTGIAYTPAKTRNYEAFVKLIAVQAMNGAAPLLEALNVRVVAECAIPQSWSKKKRDLAARGILRPTTRPDADNLVKSLDGMTGITWKDDSQIVELSVSKIYSEQPRLLVTIMELGENGTQKEE